MPMNLLVEIVLWLPVGIIPVANGAARLLVYERWTGAPAASLLSSGLDVLAVGAYALFAQRRRPLGSRGAAVGRGLLWSALTALNHFGLGALVFGISLPALAAKYDLRAGEAWPLVSLAILAAPSFATWRLMAATVRVERGATAPP